MPTTKSRPRARAAVTPGPRHYLSVKDLGADETRDVLRLALDLKRDRARGRAEPLLAGLTLGMIFQKPSLRTRVSFEAGMTQLGGHAIYLGPDDIKLGQRETTEDIALVLSRMCDLIMARVFGHGIVVELATWSTVPVINGLSDLEHPCQALGDLLTILERKGHVDGLRLVFVGDGNNVANSLLVSGALLGMDVTVACPKGYEPPKALLDDAKRMAKATGAALRVMNDPRAAVAGCDVVYTDVWASMGQEAEAEKRRKAFQGFQVDAALMRLAEKDAVILHCLPAHYGEELDYRTSRTPNSAIIDQAENRMHAQKALMVRLAGKA
jgi:ornithine carbamoyltransferase